MYTHTCAHKHIAFFKTYQHRNKSIPLQLAFLIQHISWRSFNSSTQIACTFELLHCIPQYGNIFNLAISLLVDIWIVSGFFAITNKVAVVSCLLVMSTFVHVQMLL